MITAKKIYSSLLGLTLLFGACNKDDDNSNTNTDVTSADKAEVISTYARITHASYEDSYNAVLTLQTAVNNFTAAPTAAGLEACREAWKRSRIPYGQTEAYRFYEGPIDAADGPEGLINAWPIDESYIDYVQGNATSGIINNPAQYPTIDASVLEAANENGSETNIATGFHAIEFLLWGQDLSATGPGARPYTDYLTGSGATAPNGARRATYLKVAVQLLADNLAGIVNEWKEGGTYRASFTASSATDSSLTYIVRGIGELSKGELAGERMSVALTNQDQEDEHSCFSDNTHIDIQENFTGVENVYNGRYTRTDGTVVSGKSLSSIIGTKDATKNNAVGSAMTDARTKVFAVPAPFDQAIINDRAKVEAAITALRTLADRMADAAFAVGVKVQF